MALGRRKKAKQAKSRYRIQCPLCGSVEGDGVRHPKATHVTADGRVLTAAEAEAEGLADNVKHYSCPTCAAWEDDWGRRMRAGPSAAERQALYAEHDARMRASPLYDHSRDDPPPPPSPDQPAS